ncbi:MAG: GYF domain-containing protein [Myxococcota bacterium]
MKFLCEHCKAKYQIPDEKIAGRTLRMKCRKCGNGIVLKGPSAETGRRKASSPGATRRRGGASVSKRRPSSSRHSALGAEFRRSATLSHNSEAPAATSGPEWHVAINDVPVGPIRREELARKVGSGAVDEDSLCWREGFDDWRPLAEVKELAALLEQRRARTPPRTPPPPRPPSDDAVVPPPPPPAVAALAAAPEPSMADLPIGAPLGDSLPPPADSMAGAVALSQAPHAAVVSVPPSTAPPPRRGGLPAGARAGLLLAALGTVSFAIALGVTLGGKLGSSDGGGTEVARADLPTEPVPAAPPPTAELDPGEEDVPPSEVPSGDEGRETAAADRAVDEERTTRRPRTTSTMTGTTMTSDENLSAEQRALLARLGGGSGSSGAAPSALMVASRMSTAAAGSSEPLDSAAISRVVNNNRSQLQRCYERHGGAGGESRIRVNIDLSIGASGTVTRANARGSNNSLLTRCIEGNVRRWRFARSADGAQTTFPVVFSPGG